MAAPRISPSETPRLSTTRSVALVGALLVLGWTACWALAELLDATTSVPVPLPTAVRNACTLAGVIAVAAVSTVLRPARAAHGVVAGAGVLLAGGGTLALHGTAWGFSGLYSDAGFRTEAVTRFADSPALADYAYKGLLAYYPPALPWLEGRIAALTGVPGWAVMKPVELLLCALLPLISWLLWRRLLPDLPAAVVAAAVCTAAAIPTKPDEWLVLVVVVPWWLEFVRGVRRPDVRPWPAPVHGLVLGLLLLCHTYFFVPLAIASVLGVGCDLALRRPVSPAPRRAVTAAAVGLVVALPSWGPMVLQHVAGLPSDDLQRRWSPIGFQMPPLPGLGDGASVLGLVGLVWMVAAVRHSRLAAELAIAWIAAYGFMVGGQLVQRWGVALLPEKTDDLCTALMVATGAVAACRAATLLRGWPRVTRGLVAGAVALGVVLTGLQWLDDRLGRPATVAQHIRYPDGSFPAGGTPEEGSHWHAWGVRPDGSGPSVAEIEKAWQELRGEPLRSGTILVSGRADVLETTPVHSFITWKSIYSHPQGQFAARLRLLQQVEACDTPRCAWSLLRNNVLDPVDGLVLNQRGGELYLTVTVDDFPEAWRGVAVSFPSELFAAPYFERRDLDGAVVIAVEP